MKFPRVVYSVLVAVLSLVGCGQPSETGDSGGGDAALKIAVIPKGTTHEFWRSIETGARKAEQELNADQPTVEVIWKGPLKEDDREQQMQVIDNFTTRRVSGIVLAPLDSKAMVRPVETAEKAGIPVVVIDSGLDSESYVSFVATDNFKGGQMAGQFMGELLGGKGNVILLRYAVGSASTEKRENGFLEALKAFPGITLVSSDQYAGPTRETAYQASQNLLNRFGKEVDGIFCVNENSTIGMTKALREIGRAGGEVKMLGFDAGSQSIKDMANGDVQGLVVQDPVKMGYEGVMTMVKKLNGEEVPRRIDTGVVMVTPENMQEPAVQELLNPPFDKYLK